MAGHSLLDVSCGQVASMAFLIYDICITLDDEVNFIWSKPNKSWIKWHYLFTRYFALAAQITNRSIAHAIESNKLSSKSSLKIWYMCQVIVGKVLMTALEIVLMACVFALYRRSMWIALLFAAVILGESVAVIVGIMLTRPGDNFTPSMVLLSSPNSYTYFGVGAIVSQVTILALTLIKYKTAVKNGWGKTPLVMLMVRDGTVASFILLVITTLTVVATSMQTEYGPLGNSWLLSIVGCSGCRLIINMQTCQLRAVELETIDDQHGTVQLTTIWNEVEFEVSAAASNRTSSIIDQVHYIPHRSC